MKLAIIAPVIVAVLVAVFAFSTQDTAQQTETTTQSSYSFASIEKSLENGDGALIDVRTPQEYAEGYIAGASLLPLQSIEQGATPEVEKDTTIYLYCRTGNRSAVATNILRDAGYEVVDLGGLQDVTSIGGQVVTE